MLVASCRRALRTSMAHLFTHKTHRPVGVGQSLHARLSSSERLPNPGSRRSADHIMAIQRRLQRHRRKEVLLKLRPEFLQLIQRQITQLAALLYAKADRVSNLFVRLAKGNSLVYKIRSRRHCVQIPALASRPHTLRAELQRASKL